MNTLSENISLFKVFMSEDVISPVNEVLMSGFITQGKQVEAFEEALKEYFQHPYILTLNSATSGLTLAQRLALTPEEWEKREKYTVLTPALTCFATTVPIMANNMKIGWIDTQRNSCNVDINDIKRKLSKETRIIQVVHWGGNPVDLDGLKELQDYCTKEYNHTPTIIEDCAHAFGSEYKDKKIGTHGNICVMSLQAIKHLTTGDGGLIFLPNEEMYNRAKLLRWYGIDRDHRNKGDFRMENDIAEWGYKYHMNDIAATIGLYNLPHIKKLQEKTSENCDFFRKNLKNKHILGIMPSEGVSANWLFTIRVRHKQEFINYMQTHKIMCSQVHNRNDIHSSVKDFRTYLPNLDSLEHEIVCVPCGWWLTSEQRDYIKETINSFNPTERISSFLACAENH